MSKEISQEYPIFRHGGSIYKKNYQSQCRRIKQLAIQSSENKSTTTSNHRMISIS